MNVRLTSAATIFAVTMATSALAQNSLEKCPAMLSQSDFESKGGKFVVTKPPNLTQLPPSFLKSCRGHQGLEFVADQDGSVRWNGTDYNNLGADLGLDSSLRCGKTLQDRITVMRYAPIKLKGKPACVLFGFIWNSETPDKLTRWDIHLTQAPQGKKAR